jgi:integrase
MARRRRGSLVEHNGKDGRTYYAARFHAYGRRHHVALGPVTREQAERELRGLLVDVERGIWRPDEPLPEPEPVPEELTFHQLAEQWWLERERELSPKTQTDYRWRLEAHLLPHFAEHLLSQITVAEVDRYKAAKLVEGRLSGESINKTLKLLAAILEVAEERALIVRNPAKGRRRRVKASKPRRSYLDTAEQIAALLDAAGELDRKARTGGQHVHRRAMLATLTFAGLRIGELLALRWRDVDLAAGRLRVRGAKTDAAVRDVQLRPTLRDELASVKADAPDTRPEAVVFATSTGRPTNPSAIRTRVLAPAVKLANERLGERGCSPLPDGLTPHSLRRTFASLLYALSETPPVVMAEMGHTSPNLALAIYAQAMRRDEGEVERLRALTDGLDWADAGRRDANVPAPVTGPRANGGQKATH